jgi:DNA-directed RNA polymerase specialized sigma24 family protein
MITSQAEQDDAQFVKASQQGDQEAFAFLVQRHQRRIFNLSLGMLQDEEDASEATQETFLAAWQRLPPFRGEACFATWLYRIVLILRHLHEQTYEEIAEILAIPVGTVKTHLFRARNLLKERFL